MRRRLHLFVWLALAGALLIAPAGGAQTSTTVPSIEFTGTVDPSTEKWIASALDDAADKPVVLELPNGMIFDMTGAQYVRDWALPQVAFHQMIVYALLRQAGVPLGKADYVPHMFRYLRPGTGPTA